MCVGDEDPVRQRGGASCLLHRSSRYRQIDKLILYGHTRSATCGRSCPVSSGTAGSSEPRVPVRMPPPARWPIMMMSWVWFDPGPLQSQHHGACPGAMARSGLSQVTRATDAATTCTVNLDSSEVRAPDRHCRRRDPYVATGPQPPHGSIRTCQPPV
jgi:hypothetical protein